VSEPGARERGSRTSDYDFELPANRIAQLPLARRDASRLLTVDRATGTIAHRAFTDLPALIAPGDALVLNTSRVLRARLLGTRDSGAPGEILLLRPLADGTWEAMVSPGGKLRPGRTLHIAHGFDVEIVSITDRRTRIVRLRTDGDASAMGTFRCRRTSRALIPRRMRSAIRRCTRARRDQWRRPRRGCT
jgi:S-adenosylmethionine:tRNA ribosyltransferase-isomerase